MAQVGVGKSVVGGDQNVPEELKSLSIPAVPQSLQRTQREDLYYNQQQQNGRGVSMTSPANSLGTESLVTPNTTPEPTGSPRGLDPEPSVLPPPTISTTYDRYMQTPPMNVPPYVAYPYYSQPTVYLVHPPMSYIPHAMDPMHMSYDMSVPPPNLGYMPVAPHMFPQSVYKMAPQERFVSYEQTPSPMTASPLGSTAASVPQVPQSNEVIMAAQRPETPIREYAPDQHLSQAAEHFDGDQIQSAYGSASDGVVEITELIEEVQIVDPKPSTTPVPPAEASSNVNRWYEFFGDEQHAETIAAGDNAGQDPAAVDSATSRAHGVGETKDDTYHVPSNTPEENNNHPRQHDDRHRKPFPHSQRDNQRYPSNNRRDRNFREHSNGRYDHDRRSETPDKRNRGGNTNYRGAPRDDRRYSNPEHGGTNQYRPKRSQRDFRGGDYDNQCPSRENSAVRRGDNRQRYYNSPRRDEEYSRYDGPARWTGSYRSHWRDEFNGNRADELSKPVPRGRPERDRTDSAQRNVRRPPVASRQHDGQRSAKNETRSRGSDDDSLEFLLPSAVGIKESLDLKSMISDEAVSMKCIASQKPPRHVHQAEDQHPGAAVGRKANRRPE